MKLIKKDLNFLSYYMSAMDQKTFEGDKLIISSDNDYVYFLQKTVELANIYKLPNIQKETIKVVFELSKFYNLIRNVKDSEPIEISQTGLKIGNRAKYELESFNVSDLDLFRYLNFDFSNPKVLLNVKEFKIIKSALDMSTVGYDVLNILDNHFVCSNGTIIGVIETSNNGFDQSFLSPKILDLINFIQREVLEFKEIDDNLICKNGDLITVFLPKRPKVPLKLFEPESKRLYEHPFKINVKKQVLMDALNRLRVVVQDNEYSKYLTSIENGKLHLINIMANNGEEVIEGADIEISPELNGFKMLLNCSYVLGILNCFKSDNVEFYLDNNPKLPATKIKGLTDNIFFIHVLYKYDY